MGWVFAFAESYSSVQECDATMFNGSNIAWPIKELIEKLSSHLCNPLISVAELPVNCCCKKSPKAIVSTVFAVLMRCGNIKIAL